jgi:hypothetical protein
MEVNGKHHISAALTQRKEPSVAKGHEDVWTLWARKTLLLLLRF